MGFCSYSGPLFLSFRTKKLESGVSKTFFMKDFTTYLSTAPVVSLAWLVLTAVLLIGFNKVFPDPLVFTF
uniref:Photosystem I reaction center subunit IX n=1 Tax=Chlamydomonas nivalis TaxID=47906 RepID=A0A0S2ICE0_9CHLO|nr:subunit IX of photosystem I [Chlamydomonas nivalis]